MIIKVAFYKGKGRWHNKLIRWWTKSVYSHVEMIMPDGFTWVSISPFYNSTVSSRVNLNFDPHKWDFLFFDISHAQYKEIIKFYSLTKGSRYDWIGMIASQFLPFRIKHRNRWYCSEWIAYALTLSNVIKWEKTTVFGYRDLTPGMLYNILLEKASIWEGLSPCPEEIH